MRKKYFRGIQYSRERNATVGKGSGVGGTLALNQGLEGGIGGKSD